ncbi:hypothetical protein L6452_32888 [Arctium lappa]|uniref:Uncharacterized protein n=1 Tax=Arctium lappa TaxID=4217 RepID=A0ACB8Z6Z5_ARCLA|nr:hypothetical protein L6452_32888 [Arctium lappa]
MSTSRRKTVNTGKHKSERDTKIPYVRFISAILHFFLGKKYPTEGDCNFSKVGPRVLEVKCAENEVSIQTLRLRLSSTSSTSVVTPMVHSSAIPTTTTTLKRQSSALPGPSKKANKTKESTPSLKEPEVVSQQTTLDDFVAHSSTSATTTTVPVTSIPDTTPVINPTPPVSQIAEPTSVAANTGPVVVQTSQPFSQFEGDLNFFNMFNTSGKPKTIYTSPTSINKPEHHFSQILTSFSGPNLGTVDAHVNKLDEKVDSLAASLNTNTIAINQAGEELKTLSSATATKANASHLSSLQDEVNQLKDNMARNTNQLQFLTGHVDHLTGEVRSLSEKMETANQLPSQLLTKINEPAPAPTSSFTENARVSLNIAVELTHQATSAIPELEDLVDKLEANARTKPIADDVVAATTVVLPRDDDKERENTYKENTAVEAQVAAEEPPFQAEGEKIAEDDQVSDEDQVPPPQVLVEDEEDDDEEDLDLQDQEDDDAAAGDDDDENEDPSLWFSAITASSMPQTKGVVINEAGGRQKDSAPDSSSQGKQKRIVVKGNLKLLSLSKGEQPSQVCLSIVPLSFYSYQSPLTF